MPFYLHHKYTAFKSLYQIILVKKCYLEILTKKIWSDTNLFRYLWCEIIDNKKTNINLMMLAINIDMTEN